MAEWSLHMVIWCCLANEPSWAVPVHKRACTRMCVLTCMHVVGTTLAGCLLQPLAGGLWSTLQWSWNIHTLSCSIPCSHVTTTWLTAVIHWAYLVAVNTNVTLKLVLCFFALLCHVSYYISDLPNNNEVICQWKLLQRYRCQMSIGHINDRVYLWLFCYLSKLHQCSSTLVDFTSLIPVMDSTPYLTDIIMIN